MNYESDDYVIIEHSGKKHLGLVLTKGKVLLEKGVEDDETSKTADITPENVIAVLGKEPPVGKVFGVHIEPYVRTIDIPNWGDVRIYRKSLKKDERILLKKAFAEAHKVLDKNKAFSFTKFLSHVELRSTVGKYAGKYKKNRSKSEIDPVDVITINNVPMTDKTYLVYVLLHEASHGIWFRQVPKDIQARWLKLYAKRMIVQAVTDKQIQALIEAVNEYEGSLNDYMKEMADEDDSIILKEVIAHIKKVHKLDRFDLDILYDSGNRSTLSALWPVATDIAKPKFEPSVYALTNPKEFFAESMAYYLTGTKLPKDLMKACKKTLSGLQQIHG
ncbi:MAG: hypothetical protein ACRC6V_03810 [Bacteroidales bacterium]